MFLVEVNDLKSLNEMTDSWQTTLNKSVEKIENEYITQMYTTQKKTK
jgi:hypothetical protein